MVTALVLNTVVGNAFGPYTSGQVGYDVSYPNCSATPAGDFGLIGVNGGRPFTVNPCFGSEYQGSANSAYINTGYARAYVSNITSGCKSGGDQAWQIGCSEAEYSLTHVGSVSPSMWWLDVETANSWSGARLNRGVIQGAIDRLSSTQTPVGVYSTAAAWKKITGGSFVPGGVAGGWMPAASCGSATPFMPGTKVWLAQKVSNNLDVDTAC